MNAFHSLRRMATSSALLTIWFLSASPAAADFKSGDPFKTVIHSNWELNKKGGGILDIFNSRLEYQVLEPAEENYAFLFWKVNEGTQRQNWFVQVDAYLNPSLFTTDGDAADLSLGVFPSSANDERFVSISTVSNRRTGTNIGSINYLDPSGYFELQRGNSKAVTLRLHYDASSKTITSSWNAGDGWYFSYPSSIRTWDMLPSEKFGATVYGRNFSAKTADGVISSGQAYFRNFKTGDATPEIAVARVGGSELTDNKGTISFSAAKSRLGKVTKKFIIGNIGTAGLKKINLTVLGPHKKDFEIKMPARQALDPGDYTTFTVTFSPKDAGVRNAKIYLTSSDADESSFEIRVSGRGVR